MERGNNVIILQYEKEKKNLKLEVSNFKTPCSFLFHTF